jgi:hypothetical protein
VDTFSILVSTGRSDGDSGQRARLLLLVIIIRVTAGFDVDLLIIKK